MSLFYVLILHCKDYIFINIKIKFLFTEKVKKYLKEKRKWNFNTVKLLENSVKPRLFFNFSQKITVK